VRGYRPIPYNLPRGCAMGYMPELNVLCPIGDYSAQSDQPLMKHVVVEIKPSEIDLNETNQMLKDRNAGYAGESTSYQNASTQIGFLRS
jgi:hypothetical protein